VGILDGAKRLDDRVLGRFPPMPSSAQQRRPRWFWSLVVARTRYRAFFAVAAGPVGTLAALLAAARHHWAGLAVSAVYGTAGWIAMPVNWTVLRRGNDRETHSDAITRIRRQVLLTIIMVFLMLLLVLFAALVGSGNDG
jgi:hypothetical protein